MLDWTVTWQSGSTGKPLASLSNLELGLIEWAIKNGWARIDHEGGAAAALERISIEHIARRRT